MTRGAHLFLIAGAAWASSGCFLAPGRAPLEMPAPPSEPESSAEAEATPAALAGAQGLVEPSPAPEPAIEPTPGPEVEAPPEPEPEPVPADAVTGSPAAAHHELADDLGEWFYAPVWKQSPVLRRP